MKVNWQFLKKPSVIVGAVILFFILLFMLNRGSGSGASSGQTVVNSGPTDAQVASQTQLAMAQMSAGLQGQAIQLDYLKSQDSNDTQLALATIAATLQGQSLAVQQSIAAQTVAAQVHGLDLQYQTALANNNFALDYAKAQFGYGIATTAIGANLQAQLSHDQLTAYGYNVAGQAISTAKKGDRDQLTAQLMATMSGTGVSYGNVGGKGGVYVPPSSGNSGTTSTIVNIPTNYLTAAGGSLA